MRLTVELPDNLSELENAAEEALEAVAISFYEANDFSKARVARIFGFHWYKFQGVLKKHNVAKGAYDEEALRQDLESLEVLRSERNS